MVWLWVGFIAFILFLLALDLGVINRKAHTVAPKEAMTWVGIFVALGVLFNVAVYFIYQHDWLGFGATFIEQTRAFEAAKLVASGALSAEQAGTWIPQAGSPAAEVAESPGKTAALQFLTGWLTEYSLSVDNIFVIALIFKHFSVPGKHQHRVLFWGILGALVFRGVMIGLGVSFVQRFEWLIYLFGAFLVYTAVKLAMGGGDEEPDFENGRIARLARKAMPMSTKYDEGNFFTRLPDGRKAMTPMFLVLLIIETTDIVFAVDSIPAIIGITRDGFLVFTSNVFAILGLRSLYFALAALMDKFSLLKYSLAVVLGFVGVKMLLEGVHHIRPLSARMLGGDVPSWLAWLPSEPVHFSSALSLSIIGVSLVAGVVLSLVIAPSKAGGNGDTPGGDVG